MRSQNKLNALKSDIKTRLGEKSLLNLSLQKKTPRIFSGIKPVDQFLRGGIPQDSVTEIGAPLGKGGRELLLIFLGAAIKKMKPSQPWILWVSCQREVELYPPALFSYGIHPERTLFTTSLSPLKELNRVFMSAFFKLIIIDSPRGIKQSDHSFLSTRARLNSQSIILLRDFFLSNSNGNIWARFRFNCWQRHQTRQLCFTGIKGTSQTSLTLSKAVI